MEQNKSTTKNWIYFTLWLGAMVFILATPSIRQWFWLALPGTVTNFALGLDLI